MLDCPKSVLRGELETKYILYTESQNLVYHQHYIGNKARKETGEHCNTLKEKTGTPPLLKNKKQNQNKTKKPKKLCTIYYLAPIINITAKATW